MRESTKNVRFEANYLCPVFSHRRSNPVLYRTSQQHKNWNRSLCRRPRGSAAGLSHCCYPIYLTTGAKFELGRCDGMAPKLLSETTHPPCAALRCYVARSSSAPAQLKLNNCSADGDGGDRGGDGARALQGLTK